MGILKYEWQFVIAPAPIVAEDYRSSNTVKYFQFWGRYVFPLMKSGMSYPKVGELIEFPGYGNCKVENVGPQFSFQKKIARSNFLYVTTSWKSLGNLEWWNNNFNDPMTKNWEPRFFEDFDKKAFQNEKIPKSKYVKIDKNRLKKFDPMHFPDAGKVGYKIQNAPKNSKFDSLTW